MSKFKSFECAECGGRVAERKAAGRKHEYRRGVLLDVPAALAIPTCGSCGEQYPSEATYEALEIALKPAYLAHLRAVVQAIRQAHGLSLPEVERLCGVTRTYLSHVLGGTKEIGIPLRFLIEAFARSPDEVRRRLSQQPWTPLSASAASNVAAPRLGTQLITVRSFVMGPLTFNDAPTAIAAYGPDRLSAYAENDNEIAA